MKAKLTLTVDPDTIGEVKRYARREGVSVSALFERWSSRFVNVEAGASPGSQLRGKWKQAQKSSSDPRLDYLLQKHSGK